MLTKNVNLNYNKPGTDVIQNTHLCIHEGNCKNNGNAKKTLKE